MTKRSPVEEIPTYPEDISRVVSKRTGKTLFTPLEDIASSRQQQVRGDQAPVAYLHTTDETYDEPGTRHIECDNCKRRIPFSFAVPIIGKSLKLLSKQRYRCPKDEDESGKVAYEKYGIHCIKNNSGFVSSLGENQ